MGADVDMLSNNFYLKTKTKINHKGALHVPLYDLHYAVVGRQHPVQVGRLPQSSVAGI